MMNFYFRFIIFVFIVVFIGIAQSQFSQSQNYENNVLDYGAFGDGRHDDTNAFLDAWEATCRSSEYNSTMRIPSDSSFLLQPLVFTGPCQSYVDVVIDGTLTAPSDPRDWSECDDHEDCNHWIAFKNIDGLNISGSGTIDPNGKKWWKNYCRHSRHCPQKPTGFVIAHSQNVQLDGLTFKDSPKMHIAIERSSHVHFSNLHINAPHNSPNTDGIHIQHSDNVIIEKSQIGTGDDCISIGDGSSDLHINHIDCGPGHGISIGSLGKHGEYETVENVRVSDIRFKRSTNGARIKTWQGGRGFVRNVVFERITSDHAKNPIIIDQYYCDHEHCTNQKSAVQISDISYNHIRGTSDSETAIKFSCSESFPCEDINMNDIEIQSSHSGRQTTAYCSNAGGTKVGMDIPNVSCLSNAD